VCGEKLYESGVVSARDIAEALATLERQAERLTVSHRNPEKFHEDKSELVAALARLRRRLEGQ
jgi:ubiquinone biosynthesis protein UbiJ